jgi:hypothetical protein
VLLIPFVLKSLPESMAFLLKKGRIDELKKIVRAWSQLHPDAGDSFALPPPRRPKAPHRQAVPGWPRLQHRHVLDRLLHVPVHGVCAQLLADQADGQRRLQPRLRPDLRAGAQLRRR